MDDLKETEKTALLVKELAAAGTSSSRRLHILETLRDTFSSLVANNAKLAALVPILCQVKAGVVCLCVCECVCAY
jgi:hypothetical protein